MRPIIAKLEELLLAGHAFNVSESALAVRLPFDAAPKPCARHQGCSGRVPEIVLGDRFGASASRDIVVAETQAAFERGRVCRSPGTPRSRGAIITQRYGRPSRADATRSRSRSDRGAVSRFKPDAGAIGSGFCRDPEPVEHRDREAGHDSSKRSGSGRRVGRDKPLAPQSQIDTVRIRPESAEKQKKGRVDRGPSLREETPETGEQYSVSLRRKLSVQRSRFKCAAHNERGFAPRNEGAHCNCCKIAIGWAAGL